ncbi:MAG: lytic transglycosylase domain-containing protein [Chitinophagaceae bacterium]|nr:lytic transglycosylase domain-containing protein [Chitinophagaceae bacterium]
MNIKTFIKFAAYSLFSMISLHVSAHEITFCGEKIPVADRFVSDKLMSIIKKQMNYGIISQLRQKENEYMKTIEYYLMKTGLPEDLKYVAIVESGLRNVVSPVGAAGFWQIMKPTAGDLNLIINGEIDERNDLNKSTYAACKLLANFYIKIRKDFHISSWVLTTAAYNYGIGNISKAIKRQGKNYFEMDLNKETAEYVYKIIAVKELLEYPELYMQGFGYNILTNTKNNNNSKSSTKMI